MAEHQELHGIPEGMPEDATLSFDPRHSMLTAGPTEPGSELDLDTATWSIAQDHDGADEGLGLAGATVYEVQRLIGRGGFGEVWEARQRSLRRSIAIKRLRNDLSNGGGVSSGMAREFELEALTTASLDHPNIVPVHDLGRDGEGRPVLAMKLVRGQPWSELAREDFDAMSVEDFLARHIPVLVDVAQAVAFAHSRGIVHRDLKLSQVMVGRFGEVMLMDWGLAIAVDPERRASRASTDASIPDGMGEVHDSLPSTKTATNPAGTPAYMAPEQCLDSPETLGPWTDVYLLGGILFQLLTGKPPHYAANSREAFERARRALQCDPGETANGRRVPQELRELVISATQKDVEKRLPSAEQFLGLLQEFLSGSSRRRESAQISDRVERTLSSGALSYSGFAESLSEINRARELWPLNPEVERLRESALTGYIGEAIRHGDLILAQTQAERLDKSSAHRAPLLEQIKAAIQQKRRRAGHFRVAVTAAFALLVVVLIGGGLFTNQVIAERREKTLALEEVQRQRDVAEAQRVRANTARGDAEELLGFMLNDMRDSLVPLNRLDLLDSVSTAALDYYNEQLPNLSSDAERLRLAEGYLSISRQNQSQGNLVAALSAQDEATVLLATVWENQPGNWDVAYKYTEALLKRGAILKTMGELEPGQKDYDDAGEVIDKAEAAGLNEIRWMESKAKHLFVTGIAAPDDATELELYNKSLAVRREVQKIAPNDVSNRQQIATLSRTLSNQYMVRGQLDLALELVNESRTVSEQLLEEFPDSYENHRIMGRALEFTGDIYRERGDWDTALEYYGNCRETLEKAMGRFPDRFTITDDLTKIVDQLADSHRQLGNTETALGYAEEALGLAQEMHERDPNNAYWEGSVYSSWFRLCQINKELGNFEVAIEQGQKALEGFDSLQASKNDKLLAKRKVQMTRSQLGEIYYIQGEYEKALVEFKSLLDHARMVYEGDKVDLENANDVLIALYGNAGLEALVDNPQRALALIDEGEEIIASLDESNEGARQIKTMWPPMFCQNAAIAHAVAGNEDEAFARLEKLFTYELPPNSIEELKNSPDYQAIRDLNPERFAEFVSSLEAEE